MTNFQRSYSRVWWANDNDEFGSMSMLPHQKFYCDPQKLGHLSDIAEESSPNRLSHIRRSVRSHDSGFNDSDHSPNTTSSSSQISAHNNSDSSPSSSPSSNDENQSYPSPKRTENNVSIVSVSGDRSPSIINETIKTPPTVIRRKYSVVVTPIARRISFSEPSSPEVVDSSKLNSSFRSLESFATKASKKQNIQNERINESLLNNSRARNSSLRRGKTISPSNNSSYRKRANRRRLLDCVSQVSGSTGDVYTLASDTSMEQDTSIDNAENYHHYESLSEVNAERAELEYSKIETDYNNETVTFGSTAETSQNEMENSQMHEPKEKLVLPTYDELYPPYYMPYMCSTPKLETKSKKNASQTLDHTESSITAINGASQYEIHPIEQQQSQQQTPNLFDSDIDLSLPVTLAWETCTYMEYTNPMLNGHAYSVQYWIDEARATYCHEIMSTLQTKSILHEAARSLKLNPPIAAKLIYQIQLKVIAIETKFDEIERIFESHAKLVKCLQKTQASNNNNNNIDDSIEVADNKFKEKLSVLMKTLTGNVCQFTSKLNSKIIFQKVRGCAETGADLKHFEKNVRNVIDLCQDLGVACDTKIDDIEPNVLLKDFYTLKQTVLKMIRKIFRRLMNIIVGRIEENPHDMLLRANINTIATLPTESVYNSTERFSSLNDAFIASGIIRVLLMICLDSDKISVRALSLRALTTICSSAEMIRQFIEIGGLDVVTDILTDDKRKDVKFEPELREAVSVLTQVTAPWHHGYSGNIDDLLKLSIDNLVTRLTVLIQDTECLQTLMLSAACLNNISRKSSLTFYSLMDNRSIHQLIQACDKFQQRSEFKYSAIFLYVSI